MRVRREWLWVFVFALVGCAHNPKVDPTNPQAVLSTAATPGLPPSEIDAENQPLPPVDKAIQQSGFESEFGGIPLEITPAVTQWIRYFQGRGRVHMERYLERSTRYMDVMRDILRQNKLPEDLVYIVLIESGFSYMAYSRAAAVGYWQFIKPTGRRYGLRVDRFIDERRDPVLSTHAASRYFSDLYLAFGDWYLAMAAYNSGENRIHRAIRKASSRNFWAIAKKGRRVLPAETRNYVPKFIAAALIAKNPAQYGFTDLDFNQPLKYEEVQLNQSMSLFKLAEKIGYDFEELRRLNPIYKSDLVQVPDGQKIAIRVPSGYQAQTYAALPDCFASAPVKEPPPEYVFHRVRRGETLSHIAYKYGMSVRKIASMNEIGRRTTLRVGQRIKIPDRGFSQFKTVSEPVPEVKHVVKTGENLSLIARKYGVSLTELYTFNELKHASTLKVGQELKIKKNKGKSDDKSKDDLQKGSEKLDAIKVPGQEDASDKRETQARTAAREKKELEKATRSIANKQRERKPTIHVVKSGENLSTISDKYSLASDYLRRLNGINDEDHLLVGQKLRLKGTVQPRVHVVKRGETLTQIASVYRVPMQNLIRRNSLKVGSVLFAGKRILIPE